MTDDPPVFINVCVPLDHSGTPYPHMLLKELRELLERLPKKEVARLLAYLKDWNNDRAGHAS